ncbi:MAG: replication restart helicase PriA [Eubacteriales bacterium]|jgi:primosomal protein N' (replication factor Y)
MKNSNQTTSHSIAQIVINERGKVFDRIFEYKVPEKLRASARIGRIARVPFGKQNTKREGFIFGLKEHAETDRELKNVLEIYEKAGDVTEMQVKICEFMREEYFCTYAEAFACIVPKFAKKKGKEQYKKTLRLSGIYDEKEQYLQQIRKSATAQRAILEALDEKTVDYDVFIKTGGFSPAAIKTLEAKGLVVVEKTEHYQAHYQDIAERKKEKPQLLEQQKKVLDEYHRSKKNKFLLHGITGSGKTEVYLNMIESCIESGKQALYLLPEIALTTQTVQRITERFGGCAVVHSRLAEGERYYQYKQIASGQARVTLGARSALFYPYRDLGLIILDECHEESYKSTSTPRYDSIEVAEFIAEQSCCKLVLGSATPLVESYYYARKGRYEMLKMPNRIFDLALPEIVVSDMREELKEGNRSMLSAELENSIRNALEKKEQIILFLNRRGMSTYVFCRNCGYSERCVHCDVALTFHFDTQKMMCHYCGYEKQVEVFCPACGSDKIRHIGMGTQKIEAEIEQKFPYAKIIRMDRDTTSTKYAFDKITYQFQRHEADILIGTQMVVKGFDFPLVSVVGVVLADMALNMPDIYSSFRAFCLAYQAAGRCGRKSGGGKVFVQTYTPEHYVINRVQEYDYEGFYQEEIRYRKKMSYPPYCALYGFYFLDESEEKAESGAYAFAEKMIEHIQEEPCRVFKLYHPSKPVLGYINKKHIYHVIIKTSGEKNVKKAMKTVYNTIAHEKNILTYMQKNPSGV